MKYINYFVLIGLIGCGTIPPADVPGNSSFDIRYFNGINSSLKVIVKSIIDKSSGDIIYMAENRVPFSGNSIQVKANTYLVTYQCVIDTTQVAGLRFKGIVTPEFTDSFKVVPGEVLKLSYQMQYNLKYGNYCKPVFRDA